MGSPAEKGSDLERLLTEIMLKIIKCECEGQVFCLTQGWESDGALFPKFTVLTLTAKA
jgi:hypothetical protein